MKQTTQDTSELKLQVSLSPGRPSEQPAVDTSEWSKGVCPNCGYAGADVDSEGVLWCPACGYSKKGCYT